MAAQPVRLKLLLGQRHLQTYGTFRREYDKAAKSVDAELAGTAPSRAQFYRWLCGELSGLPYPHHCRVLEKLFPGWTAAQLFEHCDQQADSTESGPAEIAQLFDLIATGLSEPGLAPPELGHTGWRGSYTTSRPSGDWPRHAPGRREQPCRPGGEHRYQGTRSLLK